MTKNLILSCLSIALLASVFLLNQQTAQKDEFTLWKLQFSKTFTPLEDAYRKVIFMSNLKMFA
jgi:hypothetical protein